MDNKIYYADHMGSAHIKCQVYKDGREVGSQKCGECISCIEQNSIQKYVECTKSKEATGEISEEQIKLFNKINDVINNIGLGWDFKSVCICGSSKFTDLIAVIKWELEKKGILATGLHYLPEWYTKFKGWDESHHGAEQEGVTDILDKVHLEKIKKYDCELHLRLNMPRI
jgi:hypothetical protein